MTSKHPGKAFLDSDSEEEEPKKKKFLDSDDEEEEEAPKKKVSFLDSDDDDEEDEAPKKKKSFLDSDDEEEDEEDEGQNVHGYAASDKKKKSKGRSFIDSDDEDEEGGDSIPQSYLSDSSEGESGEDEDDEEDDDESDEDGGDGSSWFVSGGNSGFDDDDEDGEENRRVKTQAEKCYGELDRVYEQINQHYFEVNCQAVFNDFEALQKVYSKYDGVPGIVYPPKLYLFSLIEVGNFISDTEGDAESKRIAGSSLFGKLKNRYNKVCAPFEAELKQYRADIEAGKEEGKPLYDPETCSIPETTAEEKEKEETGSEKPLTQEDIGKEIAEMFKEVGKKEFNTVEAAARLSVLAEKAIAPQLKLYANVMRLRLLNSHFRSMVPPPPFMPAAFWKQQVSAFTEIFNLCAANPNLNVVESGEDSFEVIIQEALDTALPKEELEKRQAEKKDDGPKNYIVAYNLYLVLETLDEELVKSLRKLDPHKFEYLSRVKDELDFVELYKSALQFYQRNKDANNQAKVAAQLIQHVYFRIEAPSDNGELTKDVAEWTKIVLNNGDERMKMRSVLAQIYQHALNDRFFEARDLLLKTHLQDVISQTDIATQILFNRTMAQLGLAAFRGGMLQDARMCLVELYNSTNQREMIGQGLNKNHENIAEEEQRLVPHHMRINPDLIEVAVLVSMMLEEIPAFVANPRRKEPLQARPFWRYYRNPQNIDVNGPPQSTREHIIAAAKCLEVGDWRGCFAMIEDLGVWKLMHEHTSQMLRDRLKQLIKQEGLRTTLFAHSAYFQSIKISDLVELYEMPEEQVRSIICGMIITNELRASIDQPTGTLVPLHQEPTKLQILSQQLVEKNKTFVDGSKHVLDARTNCYGFNKTDKNAQGEQVATSGIWSRQPQQKKQQTQQQQQGRRMQQGGKGRMQQGMQRSGGRDHRRQQH